MGMCDDFPAGNQIIQLLGQEAKEKAIPLSGTFELTPRCNFDCKMCYVHLHADRIPLYGRELTADEWISIAEQAKAMGMLQLCITGGEPILHPEFKKIYKALAQMGFFIILQTNASTMTKDILELLEEYPPQEVKLTIYGSNDEIYKKVCGVEKGFTRVDQGIRSLQALKIPIMAVTTIIKQNLADIGNIAAYCQKMRLPWIYTNSIKQSIRGAETDAKSVELNEYEVTDYREDVREMILHPTSRDTKPCEHCSGYRNSFWILWNGKMQFCSFMTEPDISIHDNTFEEAWKKLIQYEEELQWPEECQTCEIRRICQKCAGMLATMSGSATKVDPEYCEKLKKYVKKEMDRMEDEV